MVSSLHANLVQMGFNMGIFSSLPFVNQVTKALELVAKNSELKAAVEAKRAEDAKKKEVTPQPKKGNQALKGVSQDLLNRVSSTFTFSNNMIYFAEDCVFLLFFQLFFQFMK